MVVTGVMHVVDTIRTTFQFAFDAFFIPFRDDTHDPCPFVEFAVFLVLLLIHIPPFIVVVQPYFFEMKKVADEVDMLADINFQIKSEKIFDRHY